MTTSFVLASVSDQLAATPTSTWIDLGVVIVLATCIIWDAIRGFSTTLAHVAALIIAFKLSFSVCPWVRSALGTVGGNGGVLSALLPFVAAVVLLVIIFLLLRFALSRFIQVIVQPPVDNILGGITGLLKGLLVVFLVFAIAHVATGRNYDSTAMAKSRTGQKLVPVLEKVISTSYRQGTASAEKD